MKILIVDDEQLARQRLRDLLGDIGSKAEILEAENGLECVSLAEEKQADIILLDIRMPGMDGLEAASHLGKLSPPPAIIFTTAYGDHAIDAFNANAVDYLLKPIRSARLAEAIERASFISRARLGAVRGEIKEEEQGRTHLSANNHGAIQLIPVKDIRYLKADQKYVTVAWQEQHTLIDESLKNLENEFPDLFLRIHRNALVAVSCIDALEKDADGKNFICLRDSDERLEISRRHLREVRDAIRLLK